MPTELKEPAFGLDNFGKPKILKDTEAFATTVLMILFGKPGFLPSLPDVGMNIQQYTYAFFDEIDTDSLKAQLVYQCSLVSDYIEAGELDIRKVINGNEGILLFIIPMEQYIPNNNLVIGVETSIDGGTTYNFTLMASEFTGNTNE